MSEDVAYHATTSDQFFYHRIEASATFDVVFIDGLHTFEQTLRDLLNALRHTHERSVIMIDDVKPISYAASLPNQEDARALRKATGDEDKRWMGDVFKLVFFIAGYLTSYHFATVVETYGQLVMWSARRLPDTDLGIEDIARLQFHDAVKLMDVYRPSPLADIITRYRVETSAERRRPDKPGVEADPPAPR